MTAVFSAAMALAICKLRKFVKPACVHPFYALRRDDGKLKCNNCKKKLDEVK